MKTPEERSEKSIMTPQEINKAIAEKIFGHELIEGSFLCLKYYRIKPKFDHEIELEPGEKIVPPMLPNYCGNEVDALKVVKKIIEDDGARFIIEIHSRAVLTKIDYVYHSTGTFYNETISMGICMAALETVKENK